MIKGLFYILLFYYIGELVSLLIHQFVPGSVIGMILLFLALFFNVLNPENVREASIVITKNMAIFFVPAGVGLMVYSDLFSKSISVILTAIGVSTVLTIITVAVIQEFFEKRKVHKNERNLKP
ncbi:MAG TPA: CidA/LrgA family protein [Porphyromonadaceae bacterium]|jgi:holin-like protein|uniref:CidA/LrgA family protein n=1 Tax=Limibacterium fermenti TaxID=3229863 RepID=UPI000E9FAD0B|nr:CidA/LrgA family protein [Porphyromonadaceae bacterium]HBK31281.1 CidA/LrgA family protein [Porphyromonadaceae bacterium]HBL34601.1 CidA/LrgA family protein [Porphyromonadaceae bacterium]HBX20656.1 CidA/LrgA family protein [Porphyromonadaceae bacterium]HBX46322.1 CidA/LrgA family protein [Porphyromonadaceae bacterium]